MKVSLKAARVNAEMTQQAAADAVGVSMYTLVNWESGQCDPPITKLLKLCELYKCTVDDLRWN